MVVLRRKGEEGVAKKSRDSGSSRALEPARQTGGLRNAGVVRRVTSNINNQRASNVRSDLLDDWDMSAFEVRDDIVDRRESVARYEPARAALTVPSSRQRVQSTAAVRRTATPTLLARPLGNKQPGVRKILQRRQIITAPAKQQKITANRDHLHAPHSPSARKENVRSTGCKQRPEPTKSGRGGSRSFVPWCDRKR